MNQPAVRLLVDDDVRQALALYASQIAGFLDYLPAAGAQAARFSPMLTFDKKAAKSATHELLR